MLRTGFHWATLSFALGALLSTACGEESEGDGDGSGAAAGTSGTGGGAGKGGSNSSGGSSGSTAGKGGTTSNGGGGASGSGGNENGGAGTGGADAGASGAGAPTAGSGGAGAMNDCDPQKITCRRAAPVCDEGEAPSVEGTCYGPCVPIASCACSSAEECPLPNMYTCHLSRGRCDYYVR